MGEFSISNQFGKNLNGIKLNNTNSTSGTDFNVPMASVEGEANVDSIKFSGFKMKSVGDIVAQELAQYITHPNPATSQRMGAYNELLENGFSPIEAYAFRESGRLSA